MWNSFPVWFSGLLFDTSAAFRRAKGTNVIYRDELDKNLSRKKLKKRGDCCLENGAAEGDKKSWEIKGRRGCTTNNVEERGVIRVKVKMTRQEANRLLSKCKDGGVLEFRDVARELVQIPINRVSVVASDDGCGAALTTIPEEI